MSFCSYVCLCQSVCVSVYPPVCLCVCVSVFLRVNIIQYILLLYIILYYIILLYIILYYIIIYCYKWYTGGVLCVTFSENGYLLASGTEDGGANITDLRKLKCTKTLECKYILSICCHFEMLCTYKAMLQL